MMCSNIRKIISHRHPREGGDPVRAKRIYKGRFLAAVQTPAFAGVARG